MPAPLSRLLDEVPDFVHHAALPTPFAVGPVNCYVLPERPVTVVDPGMLLPESVQMLEDLITSVGLRLRDIDQVVVTHGHPDHFGAAAWLVERSGAAVLTGRAEVRKVSLHYERFTAFGEVLAQLGLPDEARGVFPALLRHIGDLVAPVPVDAIEALDDGDNLLAGGRAFRVHVTPGHAAGHASLDHGDMLISGDHLLPRISPNPFLDLAEDDAPVRRRSLVEYLESLDRFAALDPACVLPGHGEPFTDVPTWAVRIREHHARRADEVLAAVERRPGASVHDLTRDLFPDLDGFEIVLGLSEVAGHLDLLEEHGTVLVDRSVPHRFMVA